MNNLKICFLSKSLNPQTGYGSFAFSLIRALARKDGFQPVILVEKGENVFFKEKPVLYSRKKIGFFLNPFIIKKYSKNCEVIHALDGWPYGVYGALAVLFSRKKMIVTLQGTYAVLPLYLGFKKMLLGRAYQKARVLTAVSNFTKSEVLKVVPVIAGKIKVINHGVNFDELQKAGFRERFLKERYILSVGMITQRKGYHISLEAFSRVKKIFPDLKYVIVGKRTSQEYWDFLQKLIKENQLENDIVFIEGADKDKLADLYRFAEVFLLPSINIGHHFEGFGLVFLEAGAYGLPVIGAFGSGAEDAIKNNETGILVPQNNPEKTAEAILAILKDHVLRERLVKNNLAFSQSRDWPRVAEEYLNFYQKIV